MSELTLLLLQIGFLILLWFFVFAVVAASAETAPFEAITDQFTASAYKLLGPHLCLFDHPLDVNVSFARTSQDTVCFIKIMPELNLTNIFSRMAPKLLSLPGSGNSA